MDELTPKQKQLLDLLTDEIRTKGLPPSISEIATGLKLKSKNAVAKLLRILEDKGYIRRSGKARGIEVLNPEGDPIGLGMISLQFWDGSLQAFRCWLKNRSKIG